MRKELEEWQASLVNKQQETADVATSLFEKNREVESKMEVIKSAEKEASMRTKQLNELESKLASRETMVNELGRTMHEAGRLLQAHAAEEVEDILKRKAKIEELESSNTRVEGSRTPKFEYKDKDDLFASLVKHALGDPLSNPRPSTSYSSIESRSPTPILGEPSPGDSTRSDDLQERMQELQRTAKKLQKRQLAVAQAEMRTNTMQKLVDEQREHFEDIAKSLKSREKSLTHSEERVKAMAEEQSHVSPAAQAEAIDVKIQSVLKKLRDEVEQTHEFHNLQLD